MPRRLYLNPSRSTTLHAKIVSSSRKTVVGAQITAPSVNRPSLAPRQQNQNLQKKRTHAQAFPDAAQEEEPRKHERNTFHNLQNIDLPMNKSRNKRLRCDYDDADRRTEIRLAPAEQPSAEMLFANAAKNSIGHIGK